MKSYNVIYADPPWSYTDKRTGGSMSSGAEQLYSVMTNQEIMNMPVAQLSNENSLLFLWATVPLMDIAFETLKALGFTYKTRFTWEKTGMLGMGRWLRGQTEDVIIGVKGKVKPFGHQEKNIFKHPICEHSAKPHFFRLKVMELAAKSFEECRRLELFARSREGMFSDYEYEGWDVFGNQVSNSIILPQL